MRLPLLLLVSLILSLALLTGCGSGDDEDSSPSTPPSAQQSQPPSPGELPRSEKEAALGHILLQARQAQAAGLGGGRVQINGAWTYQGYSTLSPIQGARLVAVDLTVTGHTPNFDPDDIEIIDGIKKISYGSDPHLTFLTSDGKILPDGQLPSKAPNPIRMLLIYGFPRDAPTFTLHYWGKPLTTDPHPVAGPESGWELPFPAKPSTTPGATTSPTQSPAIEGKPSGPAPVHDAKE